MAREFYKVVPESGDLATVTLAVQMPAAAVPHPDGHTHLALHYLTDLRALQSPQRDAARSTPWRDRLAAEAWFKGEYRVYYRLA